MRFLLSFLLFTSLILQLSAQTPQVLNLSNANLRLRWGNNGSGWHIKTIAVKKGQTWVNLEQPSGEHTLLYSINKPKTEPDSTFKSITGQKFPEDTYHYQQKIWAESINPVSLNTAGQALHFFAQKGQQVAPNQLRFEQETEQGTLVAEWVRTRTP